MPHIARLVLGAKRAHPAPFDCICFGGVEVGTPGVGSDLTPNPSPERRGEPGRRKSARGGFPYGFCNGLCSNCTDPNGKDYCPDFGQPDKGDGRALVPHPVESQVVRQVFEMYAGGQESQRTITDKINMMEIALPNGVSVLVRQKGHPGRTEPGPFNCDLIRDMIKRQSNVGKVPYHGVADDGRHCKRKEPLEVLTPTIPPLSAWWCSKKLRRCANYAGTTRFSGMANRRSSIR